MPSRRRSDSLPRRDPITEAIARRAYELFLARGAGHGLDLEDWLEAERQLTATTATSARRRTVPAKATKRRSGARQTQAT